MSASNGLSAATERELVDLLYDARTNSKTGLDLSSHHLDNEVAHDLQLAVADRFIADGDDLAGWKVSYTGGNARDRMGVGYRPFGYIPNSRHLVSGTRIPFSTFANMAIEPELCLELGEPLRGAVDADQARKAVRSVRPAFELNEKRCANDADEATTLADGCGAWGIVTGEGVPTRDGLTGTTTELWNGDTLLSTSTPGDAMDDPYLSLARLATKLHEHGRGLEAGHRVITGSFSRAAVDGPSTWKAIFQGIGEVSIEFT